jgi:hypothetical protein
MEIEKNEDIFSKNSVELVIQKNTMEEILIEDIFIILVQSTNK